MRCEEGDGVNAANSEPFWAWDNIDHARAEAMLVHHLPEPSRGNLEPLGQGDFCLAFRQGEQIIRVAKHAEAAGALRRETCLLDQIANRIADRLPLQVPRLAYFVPPDCPPYTLHHAVTGTELTRELWVSLPADVKGRTAAGLAQFLLALHGLPVEIGQAYGLEVYDASALAKELWETMRSTIWELLNTPDQRLLETFLTVESQKLDHPLPPALIHCDIAPGHVLFDPATGELTGIIDFGDIAIGDPARDFIYIYEDFGSEMLNMVLNCYGGSSAQKLLRDIRKWYLLEAISWTVEMCVQQQDEAVAHGLAEIRRELDWTMGKSLSR
jgi:aminoglycoside 2''-phosphotransferase